MRRLLALTALVSLVLVAWPAARDDAQTPVFQPPFKSTTAGVFVDVVVRDKKGRPITGLGAQDFELYEDGVRQDIISVTGPSGIGPSAGSDAARATAASPSRSGLASSTAPEREEDLSFTALVFERLSPEARALAHQAAKAQMQGPRGPREYTGVFVSDLSLLTLQAYTNDLAKVQQAIDAAASRATSRFRTEQEINPSPTASAESGAEPTIPGLAARGPDALVLKILNRQELQWDRLERTQQGHSSMNALTALCESLGTLRGRKTIVFFAESLAVPPGVQERFMRLIEVANRENVAIYSVDAAGLRVHSEQAAVGRRTTAAGVASMEASASSPFGGGGTSDVFDMISRDPNVILNILSKSTGAFLISNTNDLTRGLRAIDEDRRHYYLLTYSPKNAAFRGESRRIDVKVRTPGATVRARSGYVAAAPPAAEAPAAAAPVTGGAASPDAGVSPDAAPGEHASPGAKGAQPALAPGGSTSVQGTTDTASAAGVGQGTRPPAGDTRSVFTSATSAIVVDVVVRDAKGKPVTDLGKADFQVLEDGVAQEVADMTLVAPPESARGGSRATPPSTGPATAPTTVQAPTFVALVFDRLSPEARALSHSGALAYLGASRENDFAGVFLSDLSLVTVQTFTNNRAAVRKAIDDVATRATSVFSRDSDRITAGNKLGDPDPRVSPTASAEFQGPPDANTMQSLKGAASGSGPPGGEVGLAQMAMRMERAYERMSRDEQGYTTTNALLALIEGLGVLPGRKTVVFFAEGLSIPPAVQARFNAVIAAANRANVSVYTIDAAGLRVHSKTAETARQVNDMGSGGVGDPSLTEPGTRKLEWNEDVLRQDPHASLSMLAKGTGGFLVENTNDLARAFGDIDQDRRFHYLLTYTPKNSAFNGEWRTIEVKVPGRRVQVRSRTGYLAVRALGAIPVLAYEAPALAALERTPAPNELPLRARALVFPGGPEARVAIVAVADPSTLTFASDPRAGGFRTDFTVVARVREAGGDVVRKASQPYRLTGPTGDVDKVRQGEVLFYRQPTLAPGTYTLEAAVHDALSGKAGVVVNRFDVPAPGDCAVSSLVSVARTERIADGDVQVDNPLRVGDVLVYPNTGEPVSKRDQALTFYLTVQAPPGSVPSAEFEARRGDFVAAKVLVKLNAPVDGQIRQLWRVPLAALAPGDYTWRVTVTAGTSSVLRETEVRVVP